MDETSRERDLETRGEGNENPDLDNGDSRPLSSRLSLGPPGWNGGKHFSGLGNRFRRSEGWVGKDSVEGLQRSSCVSRSSTIVVPLRIKVVKEEVDVFTRRHLSRTQKLQRRPSSQ